MKNETYGFSFEYRVNGATLSTMKAGGEVYRVARPATVEELVALITELESAGEEYIILGNGSNVVFTSAGYGGTVVLTTVLNAVRDTEEGIVAQAGASLTAVALRAAERGLTGLEFAYGIPGTVGGGVYMNAGAYGGEIKDVLVSVLCADKRGKLLTLSAEAAELSYRHSLFKNKEYCILEVTFALGKGDSASIKSKMAENMAKRRDKQPLDYPSCGSAFKRPAGHFAGALIEGCGLKGFSIGGAAVSEKHAGFVINRGGASGDDVATLLETVRDRVFEETGVLLEREIEIY